mmetsp:Transcript_49372/g.129853  ORF Transcript_49372/g.129853 Transcript_49372/m.129853 type:complete len:246 (+) Transcript_49372:256-993(+)
MQPAPPPPHPMADQSSRPLGRRKSVQVAPVPRRGLRPRVALALDCLRDRLHERHEAAGVAERRLARDVSTAEERAGQPVLRDLFARVAGEDIDEGQVEHVGARGAAEGDEPGGALGRGVGLFGRQADKQRVIDEGAPGEKADIRLERGDKRGIDWEPPPLGVPVEVLEHGRRLASLLLRREAVVRRAFEVVAVLHLVDAAKRVGHAEERERPLADVAREQPEVTRQDRAGVGLHVGGIVGQDLAQ